MQMEAPCAFWPSLLLSGLPVLFEDGRERVTLPGKYELVAGTCHAHGDPEQMSEASVQTGEHCRKRDAVIYLMGT